MSVSTISESLKQAEPCGRVTELLDAASITPEAIRWLWPGWLARGKLHVLAGRAGTGKTTIALDLAARITAGAVFPSGWRPESGNVLIWSGEDDPTDTLVPRLLAAGADRTRVKIIGDTRDEEGRRPFDPAHDVDALANAMNAIDDIALIVVDPLVSAVTGDSHKNAEVRRGLAPLVDLARQCDAALLGITHFTKGSSGSEPLERVTGSLAFGALARLVFGTCKQKTEDGAPQGMTFARAKSNIGPDGGGYSYAFEQVELGDYPGVEASRIEWGAEVQGTARELLTDPEPDTGDDACQFLADLLADGGMPAKDVFKEADQAGFSKDQIKRAKPGAGVESVKRGGYFGAGKSTWIWQRITEGSRESLKGAAPEVCSLQQEALPSAEKEVIEL